MASDGESAEPVHEDEDLDARKPAVRVARAGRGRSRRSLVAIVELAGGVANASAEALRSLNAALTPEAVAVGGLRASIYVGLRDGNVHFFEELARTSGRVFDALRGPTVTRDSAEVPDTESLARRIDYERLAQLVSVEMKKTSVIAP